MLIGLFVFPLFLCFAFLGLPCLCGLRSSSQDVVFVHAWSIVSKVQNLYKGKKKDAFHCYFLVLGCRTAYAILVTVNVVLLTLERSLDPLVARRLKPQPLRG